MHARFLNIVNRYWTSLLISHTQIQPEISTACYLKSFHVNPENVHAKVLFFEE